MATNPSMHKSFSQKTLVAGALLCAICLSFIAVLAGRSFFRQGPILQVSTEEIRITAEQARELRNKGKKASGTFFVLNAGDEELVLRLSNASCACTVREFGDQRVLSPGEQAPLTIETVVPPAGESTAAVELNSNSLNNPKVRLRLSVESGQELPYLHRIAPKNLLFRSVDGSPVTLDVYCDTFEKTPSPWIVEARSDLKSVAVDSVKVEAVATPNDVTLRKYCFTVRCEQPNHDGQRGQLGLFVAGSVEPLVTVDLQVEPFLPIRVSPQPLIFNRESEQGTKRVFVTFSGSDKSEFSIDLQKSNFPSWMTVSLMDAKPSIQTLEITVRNPPTDIGKFALILATNHPHQPELNLPVYIVGHDSSRP